MQCGKLRSPGGECRYPCPEERRCGDHCYDPATQCCRDRDGAPVAKYPIGDLKDCPDRTQRSEPTVNGCGRDGLPPALTRFLDQWGPHFAEACNTHDRCYGTCGSDRARCDRQFKANLEARCHAAFPQPPGRTDDYDPLGVCLARADKYYEFVRGSFGQRAYDKAQRDFCQCCPDVHHPPRRNPEGGIGQLAPPKTLSLHANAAVSMPVRCPGPTACTGTVLLRHFPNSVAAQPPRPDAVQHDRLRNILLGKTNFRVPGGHTSKVTVRLSKRGLRALDAHPHLPALATIRPRLADGTQRSTGDEFVLIRK
jgi:hypothetical protein